jgi:hypothetical protein
MNLRRRWCCNSRGWTETTRTREDLCGDRAHAPSRSSGSDDAFRALTAPNGPELHVHCYRISWARFRTPRTWSRRRWWRPWRGLEQYEERDSLRAWLYRHRDQSLPDGAPSGSRRPACSTSRSTASSSCFLGSDSPRRRVTHAACRRSSSRLARVRSSSAATWRFGSGARRAAHRRPAASACARPRASVARARARAMATPQRLRHHAGAL